MASSLTHGFTFVGIVVGQHNQVSGKATEQKALSFNLCSCQFFCRPLLIFFRVYDNSNLRHVWQVGPIPLKTEGNPNSSTVYALGEAAVDFDIAPAVNVAEMKTHLVANTSNMSALTQKREKSVLVNSTRFNQSINESINAESINRVTIKMFAKC